MGALASAAVLATQGAAVAAGTPAPERPVAEDLLTGGKTCAAGDDRPWVRTVPTLTAELRGRSAEGERQDRLSAQFEVWWQDSTGTEQRRAATTTFKTAPASFSWPVPSGIPADTVISWRVRADDGQAQSEWSDAGTGSACEFVYDNAAPAKPVVTSPDFPDDTVASGGVGAYATFTLASPSEDVVDYWYTVDGGQLTKAAPAEPGGPVTVRVLPQSTGTHVLRAQALDRAGNGSEPADFVFRVAGGRAPAAHWDLSDAAGSATAAAESGPVARAGDGVTFGAEGPSGTALASVARLDGTDGAFLTPGTSVIDTEKTFAVGGWVRPAALDGDMTLLSQDAGPGAGQDSGFTLGTATRDGEPVWSFSSGGGQVSGGTPGAGQWAYVLGQFDDETGTVRLYVNGHEVGTRQQADSAASGGDLQIGRVRGATGYRAPWQGDLGGIRVYDRVVVPDEITSLAARTAHAVGRWALETAQDGVSREEHGGQPLKLGGDASIVRTQGTCPPETAPDCPQVDWALVGDGHLRLDGTSGFAALDKPVVDTGESFTLGVVVRLSDESPDRPMTVLSQRGAHGDAFRIRYDPDTYSWQLVMAHADEQDAPETVLSAPAAWGGDYGQGERLAVVYDKTTDEITLYVDGSRSGPESSATFRHAWTSTGGLQVGRGHTADGWGEYLHGAVDEIQAFSGVLPDHRIGALGLGYDVTP